MIANEVGNQRRDRRRAPCGETKLTDSYSAWFATWMILGGLIGLVWIVRLLAMRRILRKRIVLTSTSHAGADGPTPRISVVVAAKDEQDNIETCIETLLTQDYADFEIIAIDDRSTDRTPELLDALQSEAGDRLKVIHVTRLREGWFGKNNAMREGVAAASGQWLLFTDADCRQLSKRTLSVAMGETLEHECDFLSITPVLETKTWWERVLQPVCATVLIIWFLPERVNKPHTKVAYANGAFMLIRRECYEAIGAHERVKTEVNEDIHLARFTKQQGYRLRVVENEDLYATHMYATPREAWRGWSRIFYGSLGKPWKLALAATVLFLFSMLPWMALALSTLGCLAGWSNASAPWASAAMLWGGVVVIQQIVMALVFRILRSNVAWSLTYWPGCLATLTMLASAFLKSLGATSTTWRGTTYQGDRLASAGSTPSPLPESESDPVIAEPIKEPSAPV